MGTYRSQQPKQEIPVLENLRKYHYSQCCLTMNSAQLIEKLIKNDTEDKSCDRLLGHDKNLILDHIFALLN